MQMEGNIKSKVKKIFEGLGQIHLVQDRVTWLATANAIMNVRILEVAGHVLSSWEANSFSKGCCDL